MAGSLEHQIETIVSAPGIDPEIRCLALVHGCACIGRFDAARPLIEAALRHGASPSRLEETALQVVAYGGYPRALATLDLLDGIRDGEATVRIEAEADPDLRGRAVWDAVYGKRSSAVLATLDRWVPGLSGWVLRDAYGRILARPGLELVERELLAVSALALMALIDPLGSHIRGALRNGSPPNDVEDILRSSRPLASPGAREVVDEALDRLSRKVYER